MKASRKRLQRARMAINHLRWPREYFAHCLCGLRLSESFKTDTLDYGPVMHCPRGRGGCGDVSRWHSHQEYREWRELFEGPPTHLTHRTRKVIEAEMKKAIERAQTHYPVIGTTKGDVVIIGGRGHRHSNLRFRTGF